MRNANKAFPFSDLTENITVNAKVTGSYICALTSLK